MSDRTLYYLHDCARLENPALPPSPHGFPSGLATFGMIALGAQDQAARFFQSDGADVIHSEPTKLFEVPILEPLPEGLNYPK